MLSNTLWAILFTCVLFQIGCFEATGALSEGPVVQTSYGPIRGFSFTSTWTGQEIYAFTGVPYASPPVGDLRFKDPVLPQKWSEVRNCTKEGAACMQKILPKFPAHDPTFVISEDCLFLNIYTPKVGPSVALPVMVYIHGGSFKEEAGRSFLFGPDFLVADGIVLVLLNYRLGAFGFLNTGTSEIPGNAGPKDQRLALLWVQQEIQKFGGDPMRVTIFGGSAGSVAVHLQYVSPSSKGLFHGVIGESGVAVPWLENSEFSADYAKQLIALLNCSSEDMNLSEKCLKDASAEDILAAQQLVEPIENSPIYGLPISFMPSIENSLSKDPFLSEPPGKLLKKQLGSYVPVLMGINQQEGVIMLRAPPSFISNFTNNLDLLIPWDKKNVSSRERTNYVQKIKKYYMKNLTDPQSVAHGIANIYTDVLYGYNTAISARYYRGRNPVYLYYFAFQGSFKEPYSIDLESKYNITGPAHGEELGYIFVRSLVNQTAAPDSGEMKTVRRLVRLWTNFAKFGRPTVEPDPLLQNVSWYSVGPTSTPYLRIDINLTMETADFMGPSMAFWDSLASGSVTLSCKILIPLLVALVYFIV